MPPCVGAALLAAFGCGGGGNDTSVGAGTGHGAVAPAAAADASTVAAAGLRTVTYHGVAVRRPRPTGRCTTSPPTRRRACAST